MNDDFFGFAWENVYGTLLDPEYSIGVNLSIVGHSLEKHFSTFDWRGPESQEELYEEQCDFDSHFFGVLAFLVAPPVSSLLVRYDSELERTAEFRSVLREYIDQVRDYDYCEDETFSELVPIRQKLRPLASWCTLVGNKISQAEEANKDSRHCLFWHKTVLTNSNTTEEAKEVNKGGAKPLTTPERAEQVQTWWKQFLSDPKPKGYHTPRRYRKGSVDDFIAWGEFHNFENFPQNGEEVKRCKKRYRDLHPPKSAKTKTPKQR